MLGALILVNIIDIKGYQSGVTFLELIITVAIIGILAAIAVPYYGDYVTRERWNGAAEAVYSETQKARMNALQNNSTTYLVQKVSGNSWCFTVSEVVASVTSDCKGSYIASTANLSTRVSSESYPGVTVSPALSSVLEFSMPTFVVSGATSYTISSKLGDISITASGMRIDIER